MKTKPLTIKTQITLIISLIVIIVSSLFCYISYSLKMSQLFPQWIFLTLFMIVLGILLSLYLSNSITKPIYHLEDTIKAILEGDTQITAKEEGSYEQIILAKCFNKLNNTLNQKLLDYSKQEENIRIVLQSIGDGVITTDIDGKVVMLNRIASTITGWTQDNAQGKNLMDVFNIINNETGEPQNPLQSIRETDKPNRFNDHTLVSKDGKKHCVSYHFSPIKDKDETVYGIVLVFKDIETDKAKQKEIAYLSHHDKLTGLYNRAFFDKALCEFNTPNNLPLTIAVGDVNGLKLINDTFGHLQGDIFLQEISNILKKNCRDCDVIARWGGDEFAILMPNTDENAATQICSKIKDNYIADNNGLKFSISLGCATKLNESENIEDIIKNAETIMYKSKLLESRSLRSNLISSILNMLYEKNKDTEEHADRLCFLSWKIGAEMGLSENELMDLNLFSMLHDIGKIAIRDEVLTKPGKLTDEEWVEMRRHPEVGFRIANASLELNQVADYVLTHHERWDGKGYPQGLKGEQIPLLSRILAVVDAFDAMTNDRPYRKAMSVNEAIEEIRINAGTQFDPDVVNTFINTVLPNVEL